MAATNLPALEPEVAVLLTNDDDLCEKTITLLLKISSSIVQQPHEKRVRSLNLSSRAVEFTLLPANGALELLFLMGFKEIENIRTQLVAEMSSAAGFPCDVDPALVNVVRSQKNESPEEEFIVTCLLMVFVAVSIPRLSRHENTVYKPLYSAHANNSHCLAQAVNTLFAALFTSCGRAQDIEERLKEFLALASSSLLRLGKENDKEVVRNRDATYILLHQIVEESPFLTMDLLEACFPYALIRNAYHGVHRAGGRE